MPIKTALILMILIGVCMADQITKECPICHKKMIKRYSNQVLTSYPVQYYWYWWCNCGHTEEGGMERGKTEEELSFEEWKKANGENK